MVPGRKTSSASSATPGPSTTSTDAPGSRRRRSAGASGRRGGDDDALRAKRTAFSTTGVRARARIAGRGRDALVDHRDTRSTRSRATARSTSLDDLGERGGRRPVPASVRATSSSAVMVVAIGAAAAGISSTSAPSGPQVLVEER